MIKESQEMLKSIGSFSTDTLARNIVENDPIKEQAIALASSLLTYLDLLLQNQNCLDSIAELRKEDLQQEIVELRGAIEALPDEIKEYKKTQLLLLDLKLKELETI